MGKHLDKLGSLDDFKAPWETESGADAEIDKVPLRRLLYNLKHGEAKAKDALEDLNEKVTGLESDLEEAKAEVDKASPEESNKKISRLQKQLETVTAERDKLVAAKEIADLRAEVLDGLEARYAKYVTGDTREELEKSLDEVKKDFGLEGADGEDDDEREHGRTRPRPGLRNPSDPDPDAGNDGDLDFDALTDDMVGSLF